VDAPGCKSASTKEPLGSMADRPNVLLIVYDTARADGFEPYAKGRETPTMSQLASRGLAYPKAIAPSCWTVPSHAAFFLGSPPRSVGLSRAPKGRGDLCRTVIESQRDKLLPEVLRRNGYATAAVSANVWISEANGFGTGFDRFQDVSRTRVAKMSAPGLRGRLDWYLQALQAKTDDGASAVEGLLGEWLAARGPAPFFWFVNLIECHSPYLPPKPTNDLGPLERVRAAEDARRYQTLEGVLRVVSTGRGLPERSVERMRHLYQRSIELMDGWLARVLEAFDRHGILDETVVLVTSDHGENFGENNLIGHAGSLDDRLLSVPLVGAGPGLPAHAPDVTSLVDLPRLVATAVGLDEHPWGPPSTPGIGIAQYDGPIPPDHPGLQQVRDWGATPHGLERLTMRFTCATDGTLKLVHSDAGERLYDLDADPLEVTAVDASSYPADRIEPLRDAVRRALDDGWDPVVDDEIPKSRDDDLEERMRLLGYL
jgi:arylsulfatase A-like enzyme